MPLCRRGPAGSISSRRKSKSNLVSIVYSFLKVRAFCVAEILPVDTSPNATCATQPRPHARQTGTCTDMHARARSPLGASPGPRIHLPPGLFRVAVCPRANQGGAQAVGDASEPSVMQASRRPSPTPSSPHHQPDHTSWSLDTSFCHNHQTPPGVDHCQPTRGPSSGLPRASAASGHTSAGRGSHPGCCPWPSRRARGAQTRRQSPRASGCRSDGGRGRPRSPPA